MKVKTLALLLLLVCSAGVLAQENKCTLKLAELPESPELFGFRAGMTVDQVRTKVPAIVIPRSNLFGVAQTSISPDFDPKFDKKAFVGVRTVSLDFLDDRLSSIWLGYDSTFKWQTVPEFVKGISQSLRLPDAWATWKTRGQRLVCSDFQMTVTMLGEGPSFRINDTHAEQLIAERREAQEELDSAAGETPAGIPAGTPVETPVEIFGDRQGKIYYAGGCEPPQAIKDSNRIVFHTVEAAEKAGYKPAKSCK